MGHVNVARVLLGGVVSGVVLAVGESLLNQIILADAWGALQGAQELTRPGMWQSATLLGTLMLYGVVLIWIYAGFRARFGPGPKTAVIAGLTMWTLLWLLLSMSLLASGMISATIAVVSIIWGIFEVPIAAVVGAWLYREDDAHKVHVWPSHRRIPHVSELRCLCCGRNGGSRSTACHLAAESSRRASVIR